MVAAAANKSSIGSKFKRENENRQFPQVTPFIIIIRSRLLFSITENPAA